MPLSELPVDLIREAYSPKHFEDPKVAEAWFDVQAGSDTFPRSHLQDLAEPFFIKVDTEGKSTATLEQTPRQAREQARQLVEYEIDRVDSSSDARLRDRAIAASAAAGVLVATGATVLTCFPGSAAGVLGGMSAVAGIIGVVIGIGASAETHRDAQKSSERQHGLEAVNAGLVAALS